MKRLTSLALAIILCISCLPVHTNAFEVNTTNDVSLLRATSEIQNNIPDADITVENGTIHVVVNDISDIPGFEQYSNNSRSSLPVSYVGGSYRNFRNVILADYYPYSQVYMSRSVAAAFNFYLDHPDEFYELLAQVLETATKESIKAQLRSYYLEQYGSISQAQTQEIEFIAEGIAAFTTDTIIQLAKSSFKSAYGSGQKVWIVRGYTDTGYHVIYYSPWTDNYVPSYNGYSADWYEGVYDICTG